MLATHRVETNAQLVRYPGEDSGEHWGLITHFSSSCTAVWFLDTHGDAQQLSSHSAWSLFSVNLLSIQAKPNPAVVIFRLNASKMTFFTKGPFRPTLLSGRNGSCVEHTTCVIGNRIWKSTWQTGTSSGNPVEQMWLVKFKPQLPAGRSPELACPGQGSASPCLASPCSKVSAPWLVSSVHWRLGNLARTGSDGEFQNRPTDKYRQGRRDARELVSRVCPLAPCSANQPWIWG